MTPSSRKLTDLLAQALIRSGPRRKERGSPNARALITCLAGVFLVMTLGQPSGSAEPTDAEAAPSSEARYPEALALRHCRRVSWHSRCRPLPAARGPGLTGDPRLDRGREPDHGGYLDAISARGAIKKRLTELWDYEKFGVPFQEGGRYFYTRNSGLQNQSVLYRPPHSMPSRRSCSTPTRCRPTARSRWRGRR